MHINTRSPFFVSSFVAVNTTVGLMLACLTGGVPVARAVQAGVIISVVTGVCFGVAWWRQHRAGRG